ncbi:MAG TPA: hypothetical protein VK698_39340 [Kofleriaceae bacterium]|nr:hypothetical protein [Kofleriaceae bacterium]
MTTPVTTAATPHAPPDATSTLIVEIEQYLADHAPQAAPPQPRPATAHQLVTKTTAELVAEALGAPVAAAVPAAPVLQPPPAFLRRLPDWALTLPMIRNRFGGGGQDVTVAQHLQLTAMVIERWGWAQGTLRKSGCICIEGAQFVLLRLGYGNGDTLHAATLHLHQLLANVGAGSLTAWNDHPGRTQQEVLQLIRMAATSAQEIRR